jgi:hypothetical protein
MHNPISKIFLRTCWRCAVRIPTNERMMFREPFYIFEREVPGLGSRASVKQFFVTPCAFQVTIVVGAEMHFVHDPCPIS